MGEIAIEILAGGDIDKEKVVDDGTYPIYANALTNDGIVGYYNDYYRVKARAVTVTGRGEVGHAQARMTDFTPVVRLLAIRSNHDCYFLENAINNQNVVVESTGVPQLTVPKLSSYEFVFKDIREEEKMIITRSSTTSSLFTSESVMFCPSYCITIGNSVSWARPASVMEELDSEDLQKGISSQKRQTESELSVLLIS